MHTCTCHHRIGVDSLSKLVARVLLSLVPEDDDSAALVDGVAKGLTNVLPSNIAFGSLSATVLGWSVGALSAIVVDVVGV
ncbi:hypothetical protein Tco_0742861 [Tanacetum coccineum]